MFNKLYVVTLLLVTTPIFGQDADTTDFEEEGGNEMFTSVDLSYSSDKGNTDFLSMYYGFSFSIVGDVGPLKDTEFSINISGSNDELDGEPFTDDQYITSQFDLWANQRISPFLFFQKSYDKTIGLNNRINYGIGAKLGLLKWLSISYALLNETEEYEPFFGYTDSTAFDYYTYTDSTWWGEYSYSDSANYYDNYYYYYYGLDEDDIDVAYDTDGDGEYDEFYVYTDSILVYADYYYTDSTLAGEYHVVTDSVNLGGEQKFWRHSIRPKIKIKLFDNNVVFDYRFYFKPKTNDWEDFLLENELKITIATFYEAVTIDFSYTDKYNSRYDPARNKNKGIANLYNMNDTNIGVGVSFMF
jgi:hypothetical protein